ncbi:restriction endonuclease subunit S [Paraburkholderia caribensis]|uniref:restriction endonuclease subunit S n=1 Tax=Paraburkholderia caribensis TaxID=75105 RepID=UPI001CC35688|nr:restriction endonuclease subunit S [Paraburkholderia caribensis]
MEMNSGYKQTETGTIPDDWTVMPVAEAFEICNQLRFPISQKIRSTMIGPYPYYGPTSVQGYINEYRVEGEYVLIGEDGDHFLKWRDMSMTMLVRGKFNVNNHAHLIKGTENLTSWFYHFFSHRELDSYLTRQGAGRYKLTKKALARIPCALPPIHEQRTIATALSDVDVLLASLDELLAKKRDIKQATMQQLLTGKQRLPGFSGDWAIKRLGDLAHIKTGSRNNEDKREDGEYPFYVRSEFVERIDTYSYDCEAILVPGEGRIGSIFHYIQGRFDVHQRVYAITQFKPQISGRFIYYYLSKNFGAWAMQNTVKATVDSLRLPTFQTFEMRVPPTLGEQVAIVSVLSDMDVEITALEQKREKTRALKQGMMQELLTGRIRLV